MRNRILVPVILIIAISVLSLVHYNGNGYPLANAAGNPKLKIVNSTYASNLTDITGALGLGQTFTVGVVVQDAGLLTGFDVAVGYSMNQRLTPPIIETSYDLRTGIFNGIGLPSECQPYNLRTDVLGDPVYIVRIAEVILGGCQVDGTNGALFTITFQVTDMNATSIDVQQAAAGQKAQLLIGGSSNSALQIIEITGAYFRNVAGIPPTAKFSAPSAPPAIGSTVNFNGTLSVDSDNPTGSSKGIKTFIWDFSDAQPNVVGNAADASIVHHIFLTTPSVLGAGYYTVTLVVIDSDNGLPGIQRTVVFIDPGKTHNVALSLSADKPVATVGDTVGVTVTVVNRGNQNDNVKLDVSYDFQGTTKLSPDNGAVDGNFSLAISSPRTTLKYTVPTANHSPRVYTVKAVAAILGNATDSNTSDNSDTVSFTLQATNNSSPVANFGVTTIVIGGAVALAAVLGAVQFMRRRSRAKEASEELLA